MKVSPLLSVVLLAVVIGGCCSMREGTFCREASEPKVSIFVADLERVAKQKGVSSEEAARLLKEAGVSGFDCNYEEPLLPRLSKSVLTPVNFYGGVDFCGPDGGVAHEEAFIAAAVRYGVRRIMVIPERFKDGPDGEVCYVKIRNGLKRLVGKAKAAGIVATIEDYGGTDNICSYAKYIKRLLKDVPDLWCALDSGNLYYAGRGEDIVDLMHAADGRIAHVHLKDQTKEDNHRFATLGLGAVPNEEVVRYVVSKGYDQWFTLENPVDPDRLADVYRQVAVLRYWHSRK